MTVRLANRKSNKKPKEKIKTENVDVKTEPATPSMSSTMKDEEPGPSNVKKEVDTIPLSLPKFNPNKQARGHFGSSKRVASTDLVGDPSYKKTKKDYSVAKDPQSSEVFKSLFTSHKDEKQQQRAHWVTYNPFYN